MHDYKRIFMLFVAGKVDEFYHKLYPGLIAYACRQLGDNLSYLAEDCVQDAVLQSYNKRNDFDSSMAWYAYILKCIAHAAVHHHRKNDSHANYIDSLSHEPPENAEITVKKKKAKILSLLSARMGNIPPAIVLLLLETSPHIIR